MTALLGSAVYTANDYAFFVLNLGIIAAYTTVVVTMLFPSRIMPVLCYVFSKRSRVALALFFFMASLTRAELAWNAVNRSEIAACPNAIIQGQRVVCLVDVSSSIVTLHFLQLITVWLMVIFVAIDLLRKFVIVEDGKEE